MPHATPVQPGKSYHGWKQVSLRGRGDPTPSLITLSFIDDMKLVVLFGLSYSLDRMGVFENSEHPAIPLDFSVQVVHCWRVLRHGRLPAVSVLDFGSSGAFLDLSHFPLWAVLVCFPLMSASFSFPLSAAPFSFPFPASVRFSVFSSFPTLFLPNDFSFSFCR